MAEATRLPPQHAVNAAVHSLKELVNPHLAPSLEEIEFSEADNAWSVTLGYIPSELANAFSHAFAQKEYKTFRIDAGSGEMISMKIRKV